MRQIEAKEFKANCSKLVNKVSETGEPIIITEGGVAVARLVCVNTTRVDPFGRGNGLIRTVDPDDDLIDICSRICSGTNKRKRKVRRSG